MRSVSSLLGAFVLFGTTLAAACPDIAGVGGCKTYAAFGISVNVVDSITNAAPDSALMIARSGTFVDSLGPYAAQPTIGLRFPTALEREGTYDLTVRSAGYREWTKSGVRVTSDGCHVKATSVTARLQR